jgi:MFS family permease|tara:strand:+ start:1272 stop:2468 length:1197 start_codon:yes stop_codon:yes gene_type:complete
MMIEKRSFYLLPTIVIAQFCCTSLWFAGNAVLSDLALTFNLQSSALGHLTSAVQFGFISGTLLFAMLSIADRFSPSKVFFYCALFGALFNMGMIWEKHSLVSILSIRFLTGFFLAGIYPVGMKIAADHYEKGLGKSLGFLVGALVLGTAFPHLLKELMATVEWKSVMMATSALAVSGGLLMMWLVPNGPYQKKSQRIQLSAFLKVFKNQPFRTAAIGYFGHMWELYAFWAFVPVILKTYLTRHPTSTFNLSLMSFFVIGIGGFGCVLGGYVAQRLGTKRTAFIALLLSCICCLFSPLMFSIELESLFIGFLLFWGICVIADSPLFSTLVAQNAPIAMKGTALTIVNCIGFSITIISIQLINGLREVIESDGLFMILALGPILGLIALARNKKVSLNSF